uniref:Phloem protein 2 n=1 Tax=Quercus lobata TaxID=97700 RepID=A0A7N2MW20_QUELO
MSREFELRANCLARLEVLSCSAPAGATLQLPFMLHTGEDIEVAELSKVCWLNIEGTIQTIYLSPGTVYEVVFVVKMKDEGICNMRNFSVTLTIIFPRSKSLTRSANLKEKPLGNWIEILVGEFTMLPENVGDISFKLGEYSSDWKKGFVVKCATIRPKNH